MDHIFEGIKFLKKWIIFTC